VVNTRIAVKTLENVVAENFRCIGNPMPKNTLAIDGTDVAISGDYAFPLSHIKKASGDEWWHGLEYDIVIDWQRVDLDKDAEYDIDIELSSDFLTGQMTFLLLAENKAGKFIPLGKAQ
jgi:hypothetical protein